MDLYTTPEIWKDRVDFHFPEGKLVTNTIDHSQHVLYKGYLVAAWFNGGYGKIWPKFSDNYFKAAA